MPPRPSRSWVRSRGMVMGAWSSACPDSIGAPVAVGGPRRTKHVHQIQPLLRCVCVRHSVRVHCAVHCRTPGTTHQLEYVLPAGCLRERCTARHAVTHRTHSGLSDPAAARLLFFFFVCVQCAVAAVRWNDE